MTLSIVATPVSINASWPRSTGELTYKVLYRLVGDLDYTVFYANTRRNTVIIPNLTPSSQYELVVYSSTTGNNPQTLKYEAAFSTTANIMANFNKSAFLPKQASPYFDITYVSNSINLINIASVATSIFANGDRLAVKAAGGGRTKYATPQFAQVGSTTSLPTKGDSVYIPFDPLLTDSQTATLSFETGSTSVEYDRINNTVSIGGETYGDGDTLMLNNQRVTITVVA
jgi:hypothetical protein